MIAAPHKPLPLPQAAQLLKLLGDENRLRLLPALAVHGELPVAELEAAVGLPPAAVSQRLMRLRLVGVVASRRSGQKVLYALDSDVVRDLLELVEG